ncbi:MAG: response regulator transcription factor [Chloroflexi bacterium]|nr:response regulator transcription factor [Chloroflexota bacterium]
MSAIRVLLADDHQLFRAGIASLLARERDIEVVGQARNGQEAVTLAQQLQPDVALLDIQMPLCTGLEAARQLLAQQASLKIIMLTISEKDEDLFTAVKAGAQGYLLKGSTSAQELVTAVRQVAAGEAIIASSLVPQLLAEFTALSKEPEPGPEEEGKDARPVLSERELEVLHLVSQGLKNREIAAQLFISENTVRTHLRNILDKLHVQNRVQAAAMLRQGVDDGRFPKFVH